MIHCVLVAGGCIIICIPILLFLFPFSVYEIRLGTVDQPDADLEWRLRPYMNTARKRFALTDNKS